MTSFDETEHPRSTDGTFSTKAQTAPEAGLASDYQPAGPAHLELARLRAATSADENVVRAAAVDAMREYVSDLVPSATEAGVILWDPSSEPHDRAFDVLFDNAYAGDPDDGAEPIELDDDLRSRLSTLVKEAGASFRDFDDVDGRAGLYEGDAGGQFAEWRFETGAPALTTQSTAAYVKELTEQIEALEARRQEALVDALRLRALDLAPTAVSLQLKPDTFSDELVPSRLVGADGDVILDFDAVGFSGPAHDVRVDLLRFAEMIDTDTTPLTTPTHPWTYEVDLTA
ncbi:hypothetical protein [Frigoribacterium sp. SL97]|uniref:hypothetical protein n=1 Tax=Frigoribacterium sp. SL97 TaxID=2994664 RepID=UPI00226DF87E|nr:hypothetical protein [Frigoribacterium sp. SL97]WAC50539.1 hypothetical protein OVA02_11715 [Frigoribacterium sp. SL97]